jgi:hypothetical protein
MIEYDDYIATPIEALEHEIERLEREADNADKCVFEFQDQSIAASQHARRIRALIAEYGEAIRRLKAIEEAMK